MARIRVSSLPGDEKKPVETALQKRECVAELLFRQASAGTRKTLGPDLGFKFDPRTALGPDVHVEFGTETTLGPDQGFKFSPRKALGQLLGHMCA